MQLKCYTSFVGFLSLGFLSLGIYIFLDGVLQFQYTPNVITCFCTWTNDSVVCDTDIIPMADNCTYKNISWAYQCPKEPLVFVDDGSCNVAYAILFILVGITFGLVGVGLVTYFCLLACSLYKKSYEKIGFNNMPIVM